MFGKDPLELGRRAALIGQANSESQKAIDALSSSVADLTARRDALDGARDDLTKTLDDLESPPANARRPAREAAAPVGEPGRSHPARGRDRPRPGRRGRDATGSATPGRPRTRRRRPPRLRRRHWRRRRTRGASARTTTIRSSCARAATRARGDYTIVSSSGYYGAYQFAPTTWDVVASHAGRLDLVGVLPSVASAYDQDEMAWVLYQWQGNEPWGGRC